MMRSHRATPHPWHPCPTREEANHEPPAVHLVTTAQSEDQGIKAKTSDVALPPWPKLSPLQPSTDMEERTAPTTT